MTVGPTDVGERALGPDLARGMMLLFIALANSHYFVQGARHVGGYPQDGGPIDSVVTWSISTLVDGRAFPMFGLLFGYGVARIAERQRGRGARGTRHLLWRRAGCLVAIGAVHGLLLYVGDILAAYGVLLLLGAWAVRWSDRWLLAVAAFFFALACLPGPQAPAVSTYGPDAAMLPPDVLTQLLERAQQTPIIALLGPVGFACPFLLGIWAGRRRVLERPSEHRGLLLVVAIGGLATAWIGAQPAALLASGVVSGADPAVLEVIGPLHDVSGVLGGLGYAAAIALLSERAGQPPGRVVTALAATGQRSMTCYLAQSVVWWVVFTPYLLDLSGRLGVAATAALATLTWAATVLLADTMRRAGNRGPFETVVRRATYGPRRAVRA